MGKMKKIILLNILFTFIYYGNSCASLQQFLGSDNQPSFTVKSVEISKITLETISIKILSNVKNPLPVALPGSKVQLDVFIEGTRFANFPKIDVPKIEPRSYTEIPIDVLIKYTDILEIYKKIPGKELLNVKMEGKLIIPIPEKFQFASQKFFEFPFLKEKQIPAILPSIAIRNFKIIKPEPEILLSKAETLVANTAINYLDSLLSGKKGSVKSAAEAGLSKVDIDVTTEFEIALTNKASGKLSFSNLKYDLMLNSENFLNGSTQSITNSGSESIVTIKTSFPLKSLSAGIASSIQKKSAPFQLKGVSGLKVAGMPEGLLNFEYDKTGSFSW